METATSTNPSATAIKPIDIRDAKPSPSNEEPEKVELSAPLDAESTRINAYYEGAARLQERRHPEWTETYLLYRNRVITNRLTQRQSVNMPLMKETIRTVIAKTDEPTDMYFESLSGDKQKEIFVNEYWKWTLDEDGFEVKDIVDKKQEGLYGISTIKLNLLEDRATFEVLEPFDVVFDRFADPSDIDGTAMYVCHRNIYRSISALESNAANDRDTITKLRETTAQGMGLKLAEQTFNEAQARSERLESLGLWDTHNPSVGETFVEVREHYMKLWDDKEKKLRIRLRVTAGAGNEHILRQGWLDEILGINFFPFVKWSDDIERTDMYPDGIGDVVRTPNKVLNAWFSQLVENRTLRNFGMNYYDSTKGDGKWIPQTYVAEPFGWYPVAGNPKEVVQHVDIPDLSESMDEMNFVIGMAERATASTATEKGVKEQGEVTLGQIKIMQANANERIVSISKFYNAARKELGEKWYMLIEANAEKLAPVKLYKKSSKGNFFMEEVKPSDWKDEVGYKCRVVSSGERDRKNMEQVQKMQGVASFFEGNEPLKRVMQKKALDILDLSAEEVQEVLDFEKQKAALPQPVETATGMEGAPEGAPVPPEYSQPEQAIAA